MRCMSAGKERDLGRERLRGHLPRVTGEAELLRNDGKGKRISLGARLGWCYMAEAQGSFKEREWSAGVSTEQSLKRVSPEDIILSCLHPLHSATRWLFPKFSTDPVMILLTSLSRKFTAC